MRFLRGGEELDFLLRETFFRKEFAEVIVVHGDQPIPMMGDLRRSMCREIQTETNQDLSALLQFVPFRDFMDSEFFAANGTFSASISQRVQLRADAAIGANEMARAVTLRGTHLLFEVRQEGVRVDYHMWKRKSGRANFQSSPFRGKKG